MDLGDFLKKAMEEEMSEEETTESTDHEETAKQTINMLSAFKMVKLGKAAVEERTKIIDELTNVLSKIDRTDKAAWHAKATVKIQQAAKKLSTLDIIISTMTIGGFSTEDQYSDILNTIIQLNNL